MAIFRSSLAKQSAVKLMGYAAGLLLTVVAGLAQAEVTIARVFVTEPVVQRVEIGPGRFIAVGLPGGESGDRYRVEIDVSNQVYRDISAFIVDETNLQKFQRRERFSGHGQQKARTPFVVDYQVMYPAKHYVVLDNTYALMIKKNAVVTTRMAREMSAELAKNLYDGITAIYSNLKQIFLFRDFNIAVSPCGQVNASSARATGDITICTETISKATGKPGIFLGILMHELGHTLLGLWGLPGADNEDMADEFAVQYMMRLSGGPELVKQFAEFFAGGNPWLEARTIIQSGDRHTISTQRIRNLAAWSRDANELVQRWNRLIYPNMTDNALRKFEASPGKYDDRELAGSELRKRGVSQAIR